MQTAAVRSSSFASLCFASSVMAFVWNQRVLAVPFGAFRHQRYRTVLAFSDFEGWVNDQGQKYQRRHGLDACPLFMNKVKRPCGLISKCFGGGL